ncbi:hypothetical protein CR513_10031, partial [Mucuna pruriens]
MASPIIVIIYCLESHLDGQSFRYMLKILWDELDSFRPLPNCSCATKFFYNALVNVKKYKVEDQVVKFLRGLNDSYSIMKSQIMLIDPFSSLNHVFS